MDTTLLTITAHKGLVTSLTRFGNILSIPHKKALFTLVESFTHMASGKLSGRWAFPLPTGCGKTRAIIEWATAVSKLKEPYSLVVSASRIEALCTMKRDMISNGIPAEQIGLVYAPTKDDKYSEPATNDNENRPFLLCSHQLIRSRESNLSLYNVYNGSPRSLCVYDESLLISDIEHFPVASVMKSLAGWIDNFKFSKDAEQHANICNWMTERRDRIAYQFEHFDEGGSNELPEACFALTPQESATYIKLFKKDGDEVMADFLAINGLPLRLIRHGQTALISYRIVIPADLNNMIVLDASYPIRKLEQTDTTLQNAETLPSCKNFQVKFDQLKRFEHVSLYRMAHRGSRTAVVQNDTKMKRLLQDVVAVIKDIPADEGALVFVYKDRTTKKNPKRLLADMLDAAGLTRENVSIETWGNETSLNSYVDRQHVILVGILHRDLAELDNHNIGQHDKINTQTSPEELRAISLSERAHCAYQAFSRGCCRVMEAAGQAKAMTGYVVEYEDSLEDLLSQVMAGVQWKTWRPVYSDLVEHGKLVQHWTAKVSQHFCNLPTTVRQLSGRRLRADVQAHEVHRNTWQQVMRQVLVENPLWIQRGQGYQRTTANRTFSL